MRGYSFYSNLIVSILCVCHGVASHASVTIEAVYQQSCGGCHGRDLGGGQASSLNDGDWLYVKTHDQIQALIKEGIPDAGMPAFYAFDDNTLRGLQVYILEKAFYRDKDLQSKVDAPIPGKVYITRSHSFKLEKIFSGSGELWAIEVLPDGSLLVTQQNGTLWHYNAKDGRTSINNTPEVRFFSQGGLMDIIAHPNYMQNGWLYLAFSHKNISDKGMTRIVRGKINDGKWTQQQTVFSASEKVYLTVGHHYGSRLEFVDKYLFFSIGDRGQKNLAQDLSSPLGKIHRVHDNGKIPSDNPFVNTDNAIPSIWSYGHRNPQGLFSSKDGVLWQTEHGPRGGDELNIITKGANYGWPLVTYGINYDGTAFEWQASSNVLNDPIYYWTPSPGISNLAVYFGTEFPKWEGNLLVSSLGKEQLHLLSLRDQLVVSDEIILQNQGRIRDIFIDSSGEIFLVINPEKKGGPGAVYKMIPTKTR